MTNEITMAIFNARGKFGGGIGLKNGLARVEFYDVTKRETVGVTEYMNMEVLQKHIKEASEL